MRRRNPVHRRSPAAQRALDRLHDAPAYSTFEPEDAPAEKPLPRDCWFLIGVDGESGAYNDEVIAELERRGIQVIYTRDGEGFAIEPQRDDELACVESDDNIFLEALKAGFRLAKVPDEPGGEYFRYHVIEPWPRGVPTRPLRNPADAGKRTKEFNPAALKRRLLR